MTANMKMMSSKSSLEMCIALIGYFSIGLIIHGITIGKNFNPNDITSWMALFGWPIAVAFAACIIALITIAAIAIAACIGYMRESAKIKKTLNA